MNKKLPNANLLTSDRFLLISETQSRERRKAGRSTSAGDLCGIFENIICSLKI